MSLSVQTRLMVIISLVFTIVFALVFFAGGLALYLSNKEQVDEKLAIDHIRMAALFENEFTGLLTLTGDDRKVLRDDFHEELDEIYRLKSEFCIFSLERDGSRNVLAGGLPNVQLLLPKGFLDLAPGYYNQHLGSVHYRMLISRHSWGALIIGIENQTVLEAADEFKHLLIFVVPLALVLIFIGGGFLSKKVMQPVVKVTTVAQDISISHLHKRLPVYEAHDEFSVLVNTLNDMLNRIEEGTEQIRQFTQDAAHELRTPLTLLRGELEMFYQQDNIDDDMRESLQKMLDRAISLHKIIEDLLLLAHSDTGKYELTRVAIQLDSLVNEIAEDARMLIGDKPIEIVVDKNDPVVFHGDEHLIRRLLLNLVSNAAKYAERGRITFSLTKNKKIIFSISDTGIGIPSEHLSAVFDRFHRVDFSRSSDSGGSGLGLSICQWITHVHGGDIRINSVTGQGTTVTVSFPLT